ncbi:MAG: hypothetical protein ACFB14_17755 [Leptolyngbyaceae cyanobacterium]
MPDHIDTAVKHLKGFTPTAEVEAEKENGFSSSVEPASEAWPHDWKNPQRLYQPDTDIGSLLGPLTFHHADPLAPVRPRDEQALEEFFDDSQLDEIIADVHFRLKQLCPEPCWEDDPFDFLCSYIY